MGIIKISNIRKKDKDYVKIINFPECALCNQSKELVESHIISKMFYKWIKATTKSKIPRFRSIDDKISQDGYKIYLLCLDCENYFSKFETYFSSKIYQPTINNIHKNVKYDIRLIKFIVSIGWRFLYVYLKQKSDAPTYLKWYERHWKEFLTDKSKKLKTNHYLYPSNPQIEDEYITDYLNLFIYRSVGCDLSTFMNHNFIWVQIPFYTIVYPLRPLNLKGYDPCKIQYQGILRLNQPHIIYLSDFSLAAFILDKCREISETFHIDDKFKGNVFSD